MSWFGVFTKYVWEMQSIEEARCTFDMMMDRDVVSQATMIDRLVMYREDGKTDFLCSWH